MRPASAASFAWALAAFTLLVVADVAAPYRPLDVDGRWDNVFLHRFSSFDPGGFRVANAESEIRLEGLGAKAPARITLDVASALPRAQILIVRVNGLRAQERSLGGRGARVSVDSFADRDGRLRLRLEGETPESAFRLSRIEVVPAAPLRFPPARRIGLYAVLAGVGALAILRSAPVSVAALVIPTALFGLLGSLVLARVHTLTALPWLSALAVASLLVAALAARLLRVGSDPAAVLGVAFFLRAALVTHPSFPAIDVTLHANKVIYQKHGGIVTNIVGDPAHRGVLTVPYPPALYVALAPFVATLPEGEAALRLAMAILEGTAPLLVGGVLRAAGATTEAVGQGAIAAAVMPEGLLVLAKGVAANIAGTWVTLLTLLALLRRASAPLVAVAMALGFLCHPGAAAALAGLVAAWMLLIAKDGDRRRAGRILATALAAAGIAFFAYYREVLGTTLATLGSVSEAASANTFGFFGIRWVHLGKLLQDLLLKYGGGPVILAVSGLRRQDLAPELRRLLWAWFAVGALLGVLAMLTPFALRFEYFLAPAVAVAAGLGAERWRERGSRTALIACWAIAFAIQVLLGLANLYGRFDPISVIIPSPRWPSPFSAP